MFRSLGLSVSIEAVIAGARATHRIDVVATFELWGVKILWIVECKHWRARVPKEKVLALHQVAQDVGSDRAFLFSEHSFQPGAVAAARSTNISLTSLAELRDMVREDMAQLQLRAALGRIAVLDKRVKAASSDENGDLRPISGVNFDEALYLSGCCLFLERAAAKGIAGDFPVSLTVVDSAENMVCADAANLAEGLAAELTRLEERITRLEADAIQAAINLTDDAAAFAESVTLLLNVSQYALTEVTGGDPAVETVRRQCLSAMRGVGRCAEALRRRGGPRVQGTLRAMMRHLIDTVYLDLTKPTIDVGSWRETRQATENHLSKFQEAVRARMNDLKERERGIQSALGASGAVDS